MVPSEESSGDRRRLGHIRSKATAAAFLLVEAAQVTVRACRNAEQVFSPGIDAGEDCESSDGPKLAFSVLMMRKGGTTSK